MKLEDATAYTADCFHGEPASCTFACPFHMDLRTFLEKAGRGKWTAALRQLRGAVVFPAIVSALCPAKCRSRCQRTQLGDEAIAVREIEAAVVRYAKNRKPEAYIIPPKTQTLAIVGAGTAGLSCALSLAQKRYRVTVFEQAAGWGGALRAHPRFAEFDADIALQFSAVEAEFRFETEITALDELCDFDAVYVATGQNGADFGLRESWDPVLQHTARTGVFLGGGLCGASAMEGIAQGIALSQILENYLQTGRVFLTNTEQDKTDCEHTLDHTGTPSAPRVQPALEDGYTEDEAKQEARRCLQCDCDRCMAACEMLRLFRKTPHKIAVEVYTDSQASQTISSRTLTREAYSCSDCGYCKSVCPEGVDLGALLRVSRAARMNVGTAPAALHDFWLREMDFAVSEGSFAAAPEGKPCDTVFFPGCQLGASCPGHVRSAYDYLNRRFGAGLFLGCCGAPAYWAGDEARLAENTARIKRALNEMGQPTVVFACATCEKMFASYLPEFRRVSIYELLAGDETIVPARAFEAASVFDPCAARGDDEMQRAVRALARRAGITLHELPEKNRCCGYGGQFRVANPALYEEITQNRAAAGELPYLVSCANCREVFYSRAKPCAHILDLVFGQNPEWPVPLLAEKRKNSLKLKEDMMKQLTGQDFFPEQHPWDGVSLLIAPDVQRHMEEKLISAADLKEAIFLAEQSGDKFVDGDACVAALVKPVLTYWVRYRRTGPDAYEVQSAYYHRMHFTEA